MSNVECKVFDITKWKCLVFIFWYSQPTLNKNTYNCACYLVYSSAVPNLKKMKTKKKQNTSTLKTDVLPEWWKF